MEKRGQRGRKLPRLACADCSWRSPLHNIPLHDKWRNAGSAGGNPPPTRLRGLQVAQPHRYTKACRRNCFLLHASSFLKGFPSPGSAGKAAEPGRGKSFGQSLKTEYKYTHFPIPKGRPGYPGAVLFFYSPISAGGWGNSGFPTYCMCGKIKSK